jgi:hypothetical protein
MGAEDKIKAKKFAESENLSNFLEKSVSKDMIFSILQSKYHFLIRSG